MPYIAYKCEIRHNPLMKPVVWMGDSREALRESPETVLELATKRFKSIAR
jgi:hypothetical protein